jgi:formylglycine-generating enzyme required for sulfatase activity
MWRHAAIYCVFLACLQVSMESAAAQTTVSDSLGTRFRLLEGGRFIQGTTGGERRLEQAFPLSTSGQYFGNAEDPAHVTWITRPFYLAETEVTVGQFRAFVEATGYRTSAESGDTEMVGWEPTAEDAPLYQSHDFLRDRKFNWRNPGFPQDDNHPVVGVSYADARAYCEWLSKKDNTTYRLPTEAEWEFACRAGTTTWFSFGDTAREIGYQHANLGNSELEKHRKHAAERQWLLDWQSAPEDGHVFTAPVGSYIANPWGLKDMHGNVWEWCEDLWLDTVYKDFNRPRYNEPNGMAVDPVNTDRPQTPANDFHTIRGGSWYNGDTICRSANRTYWDRDDAACYVGFRLARDAEADAPSTARAAYEAEQQAVKQIEAAGGKRYSSRGIDIEVRFDGESFDESALESLHLLPDLQRLRIGWRKRDAVLSQKGLDTIAGLAELQSLEFGSALNPDTVDLSILARLQQLRVLRFPRSAPLNDGHLEAFRELTSLTEFECFGTNGGLTDKGIAQLSGNRQLAILHLWENQATGAFLSDFEGCPLESFGSTAVYNGDGTLTDEHAAALATFPGLRTLNLERQTLLTGRSMAVVGGLSELQRLTLQGCSAMTDDDFAPLSHLQHLRDLNLLNTEAGDNAAAAIAVIPRIQVVRIGSDPPTSSSQLTDVGVTSLSNAFSVRELQIMSNQVTDRGIRSLGRVNRLDRLTIASDQVTGSGLGPLSKLPGLRDLSLMTAALTDVAFDHLSQARSVEKLRLAHRGYKPPAALTNEGLMKMSKATWLRELWLPRNDTAMTEEQMMVLKSQMPKTGVIPYTVEWKN